ARAGASRPCPALAPSGISTPSLHDALPILNVLAGKTFIGVFSANEHILVLCVFAQLVPLGIQAIAIHLHSGGHTGIQITFSLFSDRKSTRLNSSHVSISYAVFGLKTTTIPA